MKELGSINGRERQGCMGKVLSAPYDALYEGFVEYCKQRTTKQGFSSVKNTVYRILKWFESEDILIEEATVRDCVYFKKSIAQRVTRYGHEVSIGTIQNYIKAARTLFRYAVQIEQRESNPFEEIAYPRLPERISRNVLNESQMASLLDYLSHYDEAERLTQRVSYYRVHVVCEFLYATGLRLAEAGSLIKENIDTKGRTVYVPEGKGEKPRTAYMSEYVSDLMEQYLKKGRDLFLRMYPQTCDESKTVFCARKGGLGFVINSRLKTVCEQLSIPVITTHGFRHSLGTHLLKNGCDMRFIQIILGHKCLETTQIYTRVDKEDVKKSIDMYHPRQWKTESEK